jgi:hypothetical protein
MGTPPKEMRFSKVSYPELRMFLTFRTLKKSGETKEKGREQQAHCWVDKP